MKKLVLTSICTLALAGAAFGQGKVSWNSISASFLTIQTNSTTYSALFGGGAATGGAVGAAAGNVGGLGAYYVELLFNGTSVPVSGLGVAQPTTLAALNTWSDALLGGTNNATAGRLTTAGTTGTSVSVPWAAGTTQNVMVVGWSANLGTTWAAALANLNNWANVGGSIVGNAFFGTSVTGYIAPGTADPGASVLGSADSGVGLPIKSLNTQLYLLPVPEPSTMALAALGGASLLLFRRRK